jgi:iron complex outermembrane receptor protein
LTSDELSTGLGNEKVLIFNPAERNDQLFSGFAQDLITLHPDDLKLAVGAKLEHNSYTGFEFQPNGRLIWEPSTNHSVWMAVSRAVRTPSRVEHNIDAYFSQAGMNAHVLGNPQVDSETLIAYELGYRLNASSRVAFDLSLFYNDYSDLRVFEFIGAGPPPAVTQISDMTGETYGFEVGSNWKATEKWRVFLGYTYLQMQLHERLPNTVTPESAELENPHHQLQLRSYYDLPWHLQLDGSASYVESIAGRGGVPSYVRVDLRLGWSPTRNFDLSVVGQNLLDNRHPEFFSGALFMSEEIERSFYVKATWRF